MLCWTVSASYDRPPEAVLELWERQLDAVPSGDPALFLVLLFCRWVLVTDTVESFPTPPPKATVSNPSMQPDPSRLTFEAHLVALEGVRALRDRCLLLLERATRTAPERISVPNIVAFLCAEMEEPVPKFAADTLSSLSGDQWLADANYDLLRFYFAQKDHNRARQCIGTIRTLLVSC